MNLISFSLFGNGENYNRGAVENARLAPEIYPGWSLRFYVDDRVTVADELEAVGAQIVRMDRAPGGRAMCWRFLPAGDPSIARVIVRDCDSRVNPREAEAVKAWIASGQPSHIMRDHDHHRCYPVFGGMWGCVGGLLPKIGRWIDKWPRWGERMDDMDLINRHAWPIMESAGVCHHTSVPNKWGGDPFPLHEHYPGFVGEQIGAT